MAAGTFSRLAHRYLFKYGVIRQYLVKHLKKNGCDAQMAPLDQNDPTLSDN